MAAAPQACSSGRAGKRARKAGHAPTYPPSARSLPRTGRGVHSPPMPAAGSTGDCARWSVRARDRSISISSVLVGPVVRRPGGALFAAVQRGRRAGQLAARAQVAVVGRHALRLCRRRPQAARRAALSEVSPTGSASRSRRRRPSSNSTRETTCSRPREGSMPNRPISRRARRSAPPTISSASSSC